MKASKAHMPSFGLHLLVDPQLSAHGRDHDNESRSHLFDAIQSSNHRDRKGRRTYARAELRTTRVTVRLATWMSSVDLNCLIRSCSGVSEAPT